MSSLMFQEENLERHISSDMKIAIADLIMAWAALDTIIEYWSGLTFGLPMDLHSILFGNMQTKARIEKLKLAFSHYGNDSSAKSLTRLAKGHSKFADTRNAIAHRKCIGTLKDDPSRLVFTSTKHVKKSVGNFEVLAIDLSEIKAATDFAINAENNIWEITERLTKNEP